MSVENRQCSFHNFQGFSISELTENNNFNAQKLLLSFSHNKNSIITQFKSNRESRIFKIKNVNADSRKLNFFRE
jgi:hypothetical protein